MTRNRRFGAHRRARTRWVSPSGELHVRARVERFVEPALLLLLREQPAHGYDLLERLPHLLPGERIDMGNLYRVLRGLEEDDFVRSEWHGDMPGPAKRTYELTAAGRDLLDRWVAALAESQELVDAFVARYERGKEVNDASPT